MVKVLCIVQARLTSSRLPNKVLMKLGNSGKSIIEHVYERLGQSKRINQIVFAIPDSSTNDALAIFLKDKNIPCIRGSEDNVLERFYKCSLHFSPEIIVRATCDNPFVDWIQVDKMIDNLGKSDYISTSNAPLGTSPEVFYADALKKSYEHATLDIEREHVTPYIYRHPQEFSIAKVDYHISEINNYRLTIDTEKDYELADKLYQSLYKGQPILNGDIYKFLVVHPEIKKINEGIEQKRI